MDAIHPPSRAGGILACFDKCHKKDDIVIPDLIRDLTKLD